MTSTARFSTEIKPKSAPADARVPAADAVSTPTALEPRLDTGRKGALLVPPECLYWAVLDGLPPRVNAYALGAAFERWVPQPIEQIEARYVRLGAGGGAGRGNGVSQRFLACGVDQELLRTWIDSHEGAGTPVESIRPRGGTGGGTGGGALPQPVQRRLPDGADVEAILARIELRSGAFESPRAARRRRVKAGILALTAVALAGILAAGMTVSARNDRAEAAAARAATAAVVESALGPAHDAAAGLDPRLRLATELRRLEQTRDRSVSGMNAADRTATLIALLAAWPEEIPTRVEECRIDQDQILIRAGVRDATDGERLALWLADHLTGWSKRTQSVNRAKEGFELTLVLGSDKTPQAGTGATR